ncbi:MAG: 50S ribosomal protein L3 [Treponema sp.]|jgi:large subunit ribosomal protein L3|nr:50S ribosomal protein L3 [Treponema sp.]
MLGLYARKIGMTQVFDESGNLMPVSVLRFDPNVVIAKKTKETDGYEAVVIGLDDIKKSRLSKPLAGQFTKTSAGDNDSGDKKPDKKRIIRETDITPKKRILELRDFESALKKEVAVGDSLGIEMLEGVRYVDVCGVSKGKGFQGVVKRYGFGGGRKTHGSKFHREPGSTGQNTYPARTFKNRKLPGRMGREKVTVLSLRVIKADIEKKLLLVKGAVPGINKGLVFVRSAVKKGR